MGSSRDGILHRRPSTSPTAAAMPPRGPSRPRLASRSADAWSAGTRPAVRPAAEHFPRTHGSGAMPLCRRDRPRCPSRPSQPLTDRRQLQPYPPLPVHRPSRHHRPRPPQRASLLPTRSKFKIGPSLRAVRRLTKRHFPWKARDRITDAASTYLCRAWPLIHDKLTNHPTSFGYRRQHIWYILVGALTSAAACDHLVTVCAGFGSRWTGSLLAPVP